MKVCLNLFNKRLMQFLEALAFILAMALLSSCKSQELPQAQEPAKVEVRFTKPIPADSAGFEIALSEMEKLEVGGTKTATGTRTKATLTKKSEEAFTVECDTKADTVYLEAEVTCPIVASEPVIITNTKTPWWNGMLIGALLAAILILLLKQWFNTPDPTSRLRDYEVEGHQERIFPGHRNPPTPPSSKLIR